jgi:hypothetical protein
MFNDSFNTYNINIKNSITQDKNIRASYYGGRCEVYGNPYIPGELVLHYDFPNMYGTLLKEDFPTGALTYTDSITNIEKPGFYYVEAYSNTPLPVLPHRVNKNLSNKEFLEITQREDMIFSNGWFSGLYYKDELDLFIEKGGQIKDIQYAYIFTGPTLPLFKDFAEFVIDSRTIDNRYL